MKSFHLFLALGLSAAVVGQATATEAIVKKARCVACHAVDKKLVGPAYKDVAAKYRGDAEALTRLAAKVRNGGSGVWGEIPMPPHPADKLNDADLKSAVEWVLSRE
jgi:cytochrome c